MARRLLECDLADDFGISTPSDLFQQFVGPFNQPDSQISRSLSAGGDRDRPARSSAWDGFGYPPFQSLIPKNPAGTMPARSDRARHLQGTFHRWCFNGQAIHHAIVEVASP
jgi:hypothetical protein